MTEKTVQIDGMSCQHCVMRVKKALDALQGVSSAEVEIGSAKIRFDEARIQLQGIEEAIIKAGYKVKSSA